MPTVCRTRKAVRVTCHEIDLSADRSASPNCPSLVVNHAASAKGCFVPLAIYASDPRRLVWFLRSRGAFFGVGNQGGEAWVAVQCREIGVALQMESDIRSQPVVDCVAQK